jgi:hypothetical protein
VFELIIVGFIIARFSAAPVYTQNLLSGDSTHESPTCIVCCKCRHPKRISVPNSPICERELATTHEGKQGRRTLEYSSLTGRDEGRQKRTGTGN